MAEGVRRTRKNSLKGDIDLSCNETTFDDISEKQEAARSLISLSPARPHKSSSHVTPEIREGFGSPPAPAWGLYNSPSAKEASNNFGNATAFGSPIVNSTYGMSPFSHFCGEMLSPLTSRTPNHPGTRSGRHGTGSSSTTPSGHGKNAGASPAALHSASLAFPSSGVASSNSIAEGMHKLAQSPDGTHSSSSSSHHHSHHSHVSVASTSMLGMSPVGFPSFGSSGTLGSGGSGSGGRRRKSVITPDSRKRGVRTPGGGGKEESVSFHGTFGLTPGGSGDPGLSPHTWMVSVKVSPTLESREAGLSVDGLLPGVGPEVGGLEGGGGRRAGGGGSSSGIGSIGTGERSTMALGIWHERIEFSNALKTINSKFKGEIPVHQPVAVSQVNATAQLLSTRGSKRGLSSKDDLFEVPSPPVSGLRGTRNASSRASSDLFANSSFASASSPSQRRSSLSSSSAAAVATLKSMSSAGSGSRGSGEKAGVAMGGKSGGGDDPKGDATPSAMRPKPCNCKNSKCLKLYCDCFAMSRYCEGCNCKDCHNNEAHSAARDDSIRTTLAKNPDAFRAKIVRDSVGSEHSSGCHCKKSRCLKKYCECFEAAVYCSEKCKCLDCENYEGSQALAQRKTKIRDGRKITQPFSRARGAGAEGPALTTVKLEQQLNGEAGTPPGAKIREGGIATRQSTRSTRSVYKSSDASSSSSSSSSATTTSSLAAAAAASRRRPADVSPVTYILSCGADTRPLVISVFHYLTNSDLCSGSLVCKAWLNTAFDQDLWDYDEGLTDGLNTAVLMDGSID